MVIFLKVHIKTDDTMDADEILIVCKKTTQQIEKLKDIILTQESDIPEIFFYQNQTEYQLPLEEIIFFETITEKVYAHTTNNIYSIRYILYELEVLLPKNFIRISKGVIANILPIYSIQKNLTTVLVNFKATHKKVYVSRHYYKSFRERLNERRHYEK